jgi:hypothetical protein
MSQPFTNPTGATWQALLDEITLAYSERRQVLGQSAYTFVENRNVQSAAYWRMYQEWLEANCTSFVDYVNGPLNASGDEFLYFTLSTWRAAAGINASGFKRSIDGVVSYGHMQQGDDIGEWVFTEIQNGLSVMRNTCEHQTSITGKYRQKLISFGNTTTAGELETNLINEYLSTPDPNESASVETTSVILRGLVMLGYQDPLPSSGKPYYGNIDVIQSSVNLKYIPNAIYRSVKLYAKTFDDIRDYVVNPVVFDANGMSEFEQGKLSLCGVIASNNDAYMTSDYYGLPFSQIPNWPDDPIKGGYSSRGFSTFASDIYILINWSYTNA